jgi:hypothetical protein
VKIEVDRYEVANVVLYGVWGMSVVINSERRGEDEGNHGNEVEGEDEDEGRETGSRDGTKNF